MDFIPINARLLEEINGMTRHQFLRQFTEENLDALEEWRLITLVGDKIQLSSHGTSFIEFEARREAKEENA